MGTWQLVAPLGEVCAAASTGGGAGGGGGSPTQSPQPNPGPAQQHPLYQGLTDNQKTEAQRLVQRWEKGTYTNVEDSVYDHYVRHGQPHNKSLLGYLEAAANFNKRGARGGMPRGDGSKRWWRPSGEYLIEREGKIISYGWNVSE
jgi:hypothetical protein